MNTIWLFAVFIIVLVLITIASHRYRFPTFFTLVGGALLFGLLAGLGLDKTVEGIIQGVGNVFSAFGVIILCGAIIAKALQAGGGVAAIASDVRRWIRNPVAASGLLGYLLAVPVTCCITAYVMLVPIISALDNEKQHDRNTLLYLTAIASVLSYALIYPTPVVIPLMQTIGASTSIVWYNAIAIPLSLLFTVIAVFFAGRRYTRADGRTSPLRETSDTTQFHFQAWLPFIVILIAVAVGLVAHLSHITLINLAMLAGALTIILQIPKDQRHETLMTGTKHAGVIIYDLVGAGAIGSVIVMSGLAESALTAMTGLFPTLVIPFVLAALVQTIQGSRVVTAVIVSQILVDSPIPASVNPIIVMLMVAGGACVFSYVTDPYFWLIQKTTGDDPGTVIKRYTLPLAGLGVLIFVSAMILNIFI